MVGIDERTLARWCRIGYLRALQPATAAGLPGGKWWVPTRELARLAADLEADPDWEAAL